MVAFAEPWGEVSVVEPSRRARALPPGGDEQDNKEETFHLALG